MLCKRSNFGKRRGIKVIDRKSKNFIVATIRIKMITSGTIINKTFHIT